MSRKSLFVGTISRLETIKNSCLPGYLIAEQIIFGLEYSIEIEDGKINDIELLKKLCSGGLPFKDIEAFDEETLTLVYKSFDEMKKLLFEKQNNE